MKDTTTRENIIEALVSLLKEHDFHSITVKDIAARAHVSRMTFYRYFATKEEVAMAYIEKIAGQIQQEVSTRLLKYDLREYFRIIFEALRDKRHLIEQAFQPDFADEILSCLNRIFLKTPQERFHMHCDRYSCRMITGGFYNVLIEWFKSGMDASPEDMADLCSRMAVAGSI